MKYILLLLTPLLCFSQTVWDGPQITFTKEDGADPSLESSQDRITDLVWLTRGKDGGQLYNAKTESDSSKYTSPDDTRWAFGTTSSIGSLTFSTFRGTSKPKNAVEKDMVLHLVTENIYIDIKITDWTSGGGQSGEGGGFSYTRSTDPSLNVEFKNTVDFFVYPNPTQGFVYTNQEIISKIHVYDLTGKQLMKTNNSSVDLGSINNGMYIIKLYRKDNKEWVTRQVLKH